MRSKTGAKNRATIVAAKGSEDKSEEHRFGGSCSQASRRRVAAMLQKRCKSGEHRFGGSGGRTFALGGPKKEVMSTDRRIIVGPTAKRENIGKRPYEIVHESAAKQNGHVDRINRTGNIKVLELRGQLSRKRVMALIDFRWQSSEGAAFDLTRHSRSESEGQRHRTARNPRVLI